MQLIETKTLGTATASITFTSIPQDATDLFIFASTRSAIAGSFVDNFFMQINSVVSGYTNRTLFASATTIFNSQNSDGLTTKTIAGVSPATGVSGSGWGSASIYIPNYTSVINKSYSVDAVAEANSTTLYHNALTFGNGLLPVTAGITSITFTHASGSNFTSDSTISLYKITKGSDGIVTTSTS